MSPWIAPSALAALLLAGLTAFVLRRRPPRVLWPTLGIAHAGALLYACGDLVSTFAASDPRTDWLGLLVLYAGMFLLFPSWFLLALRFAELHGIPFRFGRSRWTWAPIVWVGILAALFVTNPWHEGFLTPHVGARSDYHALWWLHALTGYTLTFAATGLFLACARRAPDAVTRSQARTMAAATAIPTLGNLYYISATQTPPFDPTTLGLCVTCLLFISGIYRTGLFALSPVALSQILEQDSDAVVLLDASHCVVYSNPAAVALLGDEAVAPRSCFVPRLGPRLRDGGDASVAIPAPLLADVLTGPVPAGSVYRLLGDEPRWVHIESTPIASNRGRPRGHWLRLRDVTELQRAAAARAEQAAVIEAVLASSDEVIVVTDASGSVRYATGDRIAAWLGEEGPGAGPRNPLLDLADLFEKPAEYLQRVRELAGNPDASVSHELPARDGRTLEWSSHPLEADGRRVWRLRDVTERRRSEAAVRNAQKLESLGIMAGGIAHDFNNLLVSVMGNADHALAQLPSDAPARGDLESVVKAAEHLSGLTQQLLAYAGRGHRVVEPLDLSRVVREVTDLLGLSISKNVEIHYELPEGLPSVTGDRSQLQQVAMNLVLNAAEAVGDEVGRVSVATGLEGSPAPDLDAGERNLLLRVEDTGQGMDAETRARIFDPFFTTRFSGRGLGLAAVHGIVASHRGSICVESEPGRGSVFLVSLPCDGSEAKAADSPALEAPTDWGAPHCILVVDDEAGVRGVASRMLSAAGLEVLTASSGAEALDTYRRDRERIDAVLLDVTMPGMSGVQTLEALRALDPQVRVVLSSGYPEAEIPEPEDGETRLPFIHKPYRMDALLRTIREALARGAAPAGDPR